MDQAREFFTVSSIATLAGASAAVVVVTNTLRKLFGVHPLKTCAAVSLVVVFTGAYAAGALLSVLGFVLAFVNACLLFCTVIGMQEFVAGAGKRRVARPTRPHGSAPVRFFASWLHPDEEAVADAQRTEKAG